jgi:hypothetical protein
MAIESTASGERSGLRTGPAAGGTGRRIVSQSSPPPPRRRESARQAAAVSCCATTSDADAASALAITGLQKRMPMAASSFSSRSVSAV